MTIPSTLFLGVTGASGAIYARRVLELALAAGLDVDCCYSPSARRVLKEECGLDLLDDPTVLLPKGFKFRGALRLWAHDDIGAPPASGTALGEVALVLPCSLTPLAGVASGRAGNLIERASQVALKEGRNLILVPRETPLSRLHLDEMSRLAWAGAVILPACPGFYQRPLSIADLVDQLAGKILAAAGIPQGVLPAWSGGQA